MSSVASLTSASLTPSSSSEIVFSMGISGAGKSYIMEQLGLLASHNCINSDKYIESHPAYDPKNPSVLHAWAHALAQKDYDNAMASGAGKHIVDTTGTRNNGRALGEKIETAKAAGFRVRVIYVRVTLTTALTRNANRPRTVPESVVRQKDSEIGPAADYISHMSEVDEFTTIDNN